MQLNLLRRHVGVDHGFTMVTVILAMMVLSLLAVGAYAASMGDLPVARKDQDRKRAYEAAQAGVDWYMSLLRADPDYWGKCAAGGPRDDFPLSLEGQPSQGKWITVDGDGGPARFRVEIMNGTQKGGPGGTPCDTSDPSATARDPQGRFWIRSTGVSGGKVRSVLTALQAQSDFLRYVLFTNWESQDPQLANAAVNWNPSTGTGGNLSQCDYPGLTRDQGPYNSNLNLPVCVVATYGSNDKMLGSVHTNDDGMRMCGATVGRNSQDTLEVASAPTANNWNSRSDVRTYGTVPLWLHYYCSGFPNPAPVATVKAPAPVLQLPPSNVKLLRTAQTLGADALILQGQTCVSFLADGRIQIVKYDEHRQWGSGAGTQADPKGVYCDPLPGVTPEVRNPPASGLIYVKSVDGTLCTPRIGHNGATSYTSSPTCGDLAINGSYGKSVTIAAESDIIITGDLLHANGSAMLGLIANGFVRIYRPLTEDPFREANQESRFEGNCTFDFLGCQAWEPTASRPCQQWPAPPLGILPPRWRMEPVNGYTPPQKIQAAIISMRHSLIIDNALCPPPFSQGLEFEGSLATYWSVGLWGCTVGNFCVGYPTRTWTYDDRLKTQQPPYFIAPLNSDGRWTVSRRTEQVPSPVAST